MVFQHYTLDYTKIAQIVSSALELAHCTRQPIRRQSQNRLTPAPFSQSPQVKAQ